MRRVQAGHLLIVQAMIGKRVARCLYVHRSALPQIDPQLRDQVALAEEIAGSSTWSVAKVRDGGQKVSLLTYEDFDEPFPALLESLTIDCISGAFTRRAYGDRINPPILHRKELLLDVEDPRRPRFAALTRALEARGLFSETRSIGSRAGWEVRLRDAGVRVKNHQLLCDGPAPAIPRHLAALRRDGLSSPIQALFRYGLLGPRDTLFDYGCGYGSDIEGLRRLGVTAEGWDPHFAPARPRLLSDVVNFGFVLNVIEVMAERKAALTEAFSLSRRCLAVAVITTTSARLETRRPYADGFLTRRGTFQKLYADEELKRFVEETLGREAFRAGPGLVLVFQDPLAEQTFLAERQRRWRPAPIFGTTRVARDDARREAVGNDLMVIGAQALGLGRPPSIEELEPALVGRLIAADCEPARAIAWAIEELEPEAFALATARRRDDLLVYLALNLFDRRKPYRQLPPALQRDVRGLLGSYAAGQDDAKRLLFSLGDQDACPRACQVAAQEGLGRLDAKGALVFHAADLGRTPVVLRCLVGCASRYYGGLDEADLIKVHAHGGKVTALRYDAFDHVLPRLISRIKIDLRGQKITEFDHDGQDQRLLGKSRYMAKDAANFADQRGFDAQLVQAWPDMPDRASGEEIDAHLAAAGLMRSGYRLVASEA